MLQFTPVMALEKSTSYSTHPLIKLNEALVTTPPPPWIVQPLSNEFVIPQVSNMSSLEGQ